MVRPKILYVEDNEINQEIFLSTLESDYDVKCVDNAEEAYKIFQEERPHITITDIFLPNKDGFWLIEEIRKNVDYKATILVTTGKGDKATVLKAIKVGAFDFLERPYDPETLNFTLARALEHKDLLNKIESTAMQEEIQKLLEVLAHDVASPTTTILWAANTLKKKLDQKYPQLEKIVVNAGRIHDMLVLVRELRMIMSGQKKLELGPVSLREQIDKLPNLFGAKLVRKELELEITGPKDVYFIGEEKSFLNQVLNNFINNAIKFSEGGSTIKMNIKETEDKIVIEVHDGGVGIPKESLSVIFNPDAGIKTKGTHGEIGTGYGLPLSKKYVELYGGRVWATSKTVQEDPVDHGTSMYTELIKAKKPSS